MHADPHRGPYKNGPGALNVPVAIGGLIVEPGDLIVGDEDGVVASKALCGEATARPGAGIRRAQKDQCFQGKIGASGRLTAACGDKRRTLCLHGLTASTNNRGGETQ